MKNAAINNPPPTREDVAKAMSRKPVEGCSKGPWRANIYLGGAYAIDRVAPNGDVLTRIAVADGAMETRANGELLAMALDLQDENQVLQAAVRMLEGVLDRLVSMSEMDQVARDGELGECRTRRQLWEDKDMPSEIVNARAVLALLPTEGDSDDTIER